MSGDFKSNEKFMYMRILASFSNGKIRVNFFNFSLTTKIGIVREYEVIFVIILTFLGIGSESVRNRFRIGSESTLNLSDEGISAYSVNSVQENNLLSNY